MIISVTGAGEAFAGSYNAFSEDGDTVAGACDGFSEDGDPFAGACDAFFGPYNTRRMMRNWCV